MHNGEQMDGCRALRSRSGDGFEALGVRHGLHLYIQTTRTRRAYTWYRGQY